MFPFDAVLVLAPSLSPVALGDDRVILLGDREHRVLTGRGIACVVSAVDGRRTKQEVVDAAGAVIGDIAALSAVQELERAGHLIIRPRDVESESLAFWHSMGAPLPEALDRLRETRVVVHRIGNVGADATADLLAGLKGVGLGACLEGEESTSFDPRASVIAPRFDLWLVDDYDRSELDAVNREHLASRVPWGIVGTRGSTGWIGPLFGRPGYPCWRCLVHWLRANRPVREFLRGPDRQGEFIPTGCAALPASRRGILNIACISLAQAIADPDSPHRLNDHVVTMDLRNLECVHEYVVRRPQCPACGEPGLMREKGEKAIELRPIPKQRPHDAGYRQKSAGESRERFRRLVSAHVGPVAFLQAMPDRPSPLHAVQVSGYLVRPPSADRIEDCVRVCAGKGRSTEQAEISALFEALERRSGHYEGDEPRVHASLNELGDAAFCPSVLHGFSSRQYAQRVVLNRDARDRSQWVPEPLDPHTRIDWTPAWSLTTGSKRYVPFTFCFAGSPIEAGRAYCPTNGNGVAAGTCMEEAILQALLELVERDAVAIWWYNRIRRGTFDESALRCDPYTDSLLDDYSNRGIRVNVLDLTHDIGIPVCACVAHRVHEGREVVALGFGCHLSFEVALRRALTEVNQIGPGIHPGTGRPFLDTERLDDRSFLFPVEGPRNARVPEAGFDGPNLKADVEECLRRLHGVGLEACVVDKTRPDLDISVAHAVVPGMRHFWPRFAPGRLYDVPVALGWLDQPIAEERLNPVPLTL